MRKPRRCALSEIPFEPQSHLERRRHWALVSTCSLGRGITQEFEMTVTVHIELQYEFEVHAQADEVFSVLSNVPLSVSHFPKVHRLVDLGEGVYQWEMEKVGTKQVHLQTVYACKYVSDKAKRTVKWTPVKGIGNAEVRGSWKIKDKKTSTQVTLNIEADVSVALPALMRVVVEPVVRKEFEALVDQYVANLIERFGGEVE
jgi:carbon monoxide dehydrogenase subunit G